MTSNAGLLASSQRRARSRLGIVLGAAIMTAVGALSTPAAAYDFPRVKVLEPNVRFWKNVYAVWSVNQIAFHDDADFNIVYRVVKVPARGKRIAGLTRSKTIKKARAEITTALASLAKKKPKSAAGLEGVEKELFTALKNVKRTDKYTRVGHLRAQNGLRERFRSGYIRAGRFEPEVRTYLKSAGLPEEIVALAYVESLMTIRAKSHAGAQGIWQFMPATGREYMQVHSVLDERHDPILATVAAAKYLNTARKKVGPWPVAITSYNYGRSGVRRLIKQAGSNDLGVILQKAKASRFKIAARNYYASFLAVTDVLKTPQRYFPGAKQNRLWKYDVVRLPFPMTAPQLVKQTALSKAQLTSFNPALTSSARNGKALLPTGFSLRVPRGKGKAITAALVKTDKSIRIAALSTVGRTHKANGKQTIAQIAKRFKVPSRDVADLNGLKETDTPKKRTRVAIPAKPIRFSLLPSAKRIGIPTAPALKNVRLARAALVETAPPPKKKPKRRRRKPPERVKATLVSVVEVPEELDAMGGVDAIVGGIGTIPNVDFIVGIEGADAFALGPEETDVDPTRTPPDPTLPTS